MPRWTWCCARRTERVQQSSGASGEEPGSIWRATPPRGGLLLGTPRGSDTGLRRSPRSQRGPHDRASSPTGAHRAPTRHGRARNSPHGVRNGDPAEDREFSPPNALVPVPPLVRTEREFAFPCNSGSHCLREGQIESAAGSRAAFFRTWGGVAEGRSGAQVAAIGAWAVGALDSPW